MTRRERIAATIARQPVDRIPCAYDFTGGAWRHLERHYGLDGDALLEHIGEHLHYISAGLPEGREPRRDGAGAARDEFGCAFAYEGWMGRTMGDAGMLLSPALDAPSFVGYEYPDGAAPGRFRHIDEAALRASDRFTVLGLTGLFDISWHLRGFARWLEDMAAEPRFAAESIERAANYNIGILAQAPAGLDGIRVLEDWGTERGMLMSPASWRRLLKPALKRLYAFARSRGLAVMIHSCGDIAPIFPDLIEIGVQVHPVQPEAMDIASLKRAYGRDLVLYGGMGCQSTLPLGTPHDVWREARDRARVLGDGGGYIIGPAGAIPVEAPVENVVALVEFCRAGCPLDGAYGGP